MHVLATLQLAKCDSILLQIMALFVFPVPYSGFCEQARIVVTLWVWILEVPCSKLILDCDSSELGCAHLPHTHTHTCAHTHTHTLSNSSLTNLRTVIAFYVYYLFVCTTMHRSLRLIVRSWLDIPTFTTRRLHACNHARAPSGGRWNCGQEMSGNFTETTTSTLFRDLLHAVKLRHEMDGFTSCLKEGVLRIFSP
jgi:hypothetical protein